MSIHLYANIFTEPRRPLTDHVVIHRCDFVDTVAFHPLRKLSNTLIIRETRNILATKKYSLVQAIPICRAPEYPKTHLQSFIEMLPVSEWPEFVGQGVHEAAYPEKSL